MERLSIACLLFASSLCHAAATPVHPPTQTNDFNIRSSGIGDSGTINIYGLQHPTGAITSLQIEAFGRHFNFPTHLLDTLSVDSLNTLQLSYDPGEMSLNGKILYIRLQPLPAGIAHSDIVITINENGQFYILSDEYQ